MPKACFQHDAAHLDRARHRRQRCSIPLPAAIATIPAAHRADIKRPDFLVALDGVGVIALDAKAKAFIDGCFILDASERRRLDGFESVFGIPVWYACFPPEEQGRCYLFRNRDLAGAWSTRRGGARIAAQRYAQLGRLIAYVIAGHHAGLANGTGGDGDIAPLARRLDPEKYRDAPACAGREADFTLPADLAWPSFAPHPDKDVGRDRQGHCLSLLTRMLFSALVDADRLDTEAFYVKAEGNNIVKRVLLRPRILCKQTIEHSH